MENDFVDYLNFVDTVQGKPFVQNWASKWREHVLVALLADGVLDADAVDHLPLGGNDGRWPWSFHLLLLILEVEDLLGATFTFVGYVVLIISKGVLKLSKREMVLEVKRLIFLPGARLESTNVVLKPAEVLNAVSETLRNSLYLHWLI